MASFTSSPDSPAKKSTKKRKNSIPIKPLRTPKKLCQKENKGGEPSTFESLLLDWEEEVTTDEIVKSTPEKDSVAKKNIDDSDLTIGNKLVDDSPSKQNNSTLSALRTLEKSSDVDGIKDAVSLKLSPTKGPQGTEKSDTVESPDNEKISIPERESKIEENIQEEATVINITNLVPSSLSNASEHNETISGSTLGKSGEDVSVNKTSSNLEITSEEESEPKTIIIKPEAKDSGDATAPYHGKNKKVTDVSEIPLPQDIYPEKTDVKKEEINPKLKDKSYNPLVFSQSLDINPKPYVNTGKKVDIEIFCGKNIKPPKELIANASKIITLNFVKEGEETVTPGKINLFNVILSQTPPPDFVPACPDHTILEFMESENQPSTSRRPVGSAEAHTSKIPSRKVKASQIKSGVENTGMANISISEKQPTSSKRKVKILSHNPREKGTPTAEASKAPEENKRNLSS